MAMIHTAEVSRLRHLRMVARQAVAILEADLDRDVPAVAALTGVSPSAIYRAWRARHPERSPRETRAVPLRWKHIRMIARQAVAILEHDPDKSVQMVATLTGIHRSSIYQAWRLQHPGSTPRGGGARSYSSQILSLVRARAAIAAQTQLLCDIMLDHIPARGDGETAAEIFQATADDYGTVSKTPEASTRRLWRMLRRLLDRGLIEHRGEPRTTEARYLRTRLALAAPSFDPGDET